MNWYALFYPQLMILIPAFVTLLTKTRPSSTLDAELQRAIIRRRTWSLWLATAGSSLLHLGVHRFMSPENAQWLWPLFFPLWFVWAIPLLQAKECGWCSPSHRGHERAASLRPRDMERHVPTGAWLASGAVGALLTAATA